MARRGFQDLDEILVQHKEDLKVNNWSIYGDSAINNRELLIPRTQSSKVDTLGDTIKPSKKGGASKNDIFNTIQTISKPATKMSKQELELLRKGQLALFSDSNLDIPVNNKKQEESMSVPIYHSTATTTPIYANSYENHNSLGSTGTNPPKAYHGDDDDRMESSCFLKSASVASIPSEATNYNKEPVPAKPEPEAWKPLPHRIHVSPAKSHQLTFKALRNGPDDIFLSFVPIGKNFLGEGRYAKVFLGSYSRASLSEAESQQHSAVESLLQPCAVKVLNDTPEAQIVGHDEAAVLRRVANIHPNIVHMIALKDLAELNALSASDSDSSANSSSLVDKPVVSRPSRLIIVLEYLPMGNLWSWMRQHRLNIGLALWLKWARQLAGALCAIHSVGLIHHDIKPHNILLSDVLDLMLSDFGNSCFVPESGSLDASISTDRHQTPDLISESSSSRNLSPEYPKASSSPVSPKSNSLTNGLGRGTLAYSAPELIEKDGTYSFPVDIYSLGVTLFTVISGQEPFKLARSSVQMMFGIQKGFFESGMQPSASNSSLPNSPTSPTSLGEFDSGLQDIGKWRFLNGEYVPDQIVSFVRSMVRRDPDGRPTALEALQFLERFDD